MRKLPPQVISLIHYTELSKAGWWETTVDRCVLGTMWLIKGSTPVNELRDRIRKELDLDLKVSEIGEALTRLSNAGQITNVGSGRWQLTITTEQQLTKQVDETKSLEKSVQERFEATLKAACPELNTTKYWGLFTDKFLIPLITDVGARIYEFFLARSKQDEWVSYTDSFLDQIPENFRDAVSKVVFDFLDPSDSQIAQYMLSYLDAYFVITSSGLSAKTAKKLSDLRSKPADFIIFVDTNFLFSILGLHSNPLNETANDLMEIVKSLSEQVKVRFVISPITLKETQKSIKYYKNQLGNPAYPLNIAEVANKANMSGIYGTFFERVKKSGREISPQDYFAFYENNLIRILEEKGVSVFEHGDIEKYKDYPDVLSDINRQITYETEKRGQYAKSQMQIENDVLLWHIVEDQRDVRSQIPLEAKYWIVTVDHRFLIFDRHKARQTSTTPVCMLPAQFIQILRFFVPRSEQLERIMLDTMRFPLIVREFDPKAERLTLRILKRLATLESIENASEDTIEKVTMDELVRSRLEMDPNMSDEDEASIIKTSLLKQVKEYEEVTKKREKEIAGLKDTAETTSRQADDLKKEVLSLRERQFQQESEHRQLQENLQKILEDQLKVKEEANRQKAIGDFLKRHLFIILPYPVLLAVIWLVLLSRIQPILLAYATSIGITLLVAFGITRYVLSEAGKDLYVSQTPIYLKVKDKLQIIVLMPLILSAVWEVMSKVLGEIVKFWIIPPKP